MYDIVHENINSQLMRSTDFAYISSGSSDRDGQPLLHFLSTLRPLSNSTIDPYVKLSTISYRPGHVTSTFKHGTQV